MGHQGVDQPDDWEYPMKHLASMPLVARVVTRTYYLASLDYFRRHKTIAVLAIGVVLPAIGIPELLLTPWVAIVDRGSSLVWRILASIGTSILVFGFVRQGFVFIPSTMCLGVVGRRSVAIYIAAFRFILVDWVPLMFAAVAMIRFDLGRAVALVFIIFIQCTFAFGIFEYYGFGVARHRGPLCRNSRISLRPVFYRYFLFPLTSQLVARIFLAASVGCFSALMCRDISINRSVAASIIALLLVVFTGCMAHGCADNFRDEQLKRARMLGGSVRANSVRLCVNLIAHIAIGLALATSFILVRRM
jgi:hypothetical protein